MNGKVVAIGLLTEGDLKRLGTSFTRHYPVVEDDLFADLIDRLNALPARPIAEQSSRREH